MPLVSILVIYSAKMHTLPSITLGLKRYSFPFSAVNSAIAHPCLVTLTPSEEIALFVSLGVSTTSSLSLYAPRVCLILVTSFPTFTASARDTDLVVPVLSVTSKIFPSVSVASTFSAPAVAVSHFLIASPVAVLALSAAVSHSDLASEKSISRFSSASTLASSLEIRMISADFLAFSLETRLRSSLTRCASREFRSISAFRRVSSALFLASSRFLRWLSLLTLSSSASARSFSALALALSLSSRTFSALALSASEPSIEEDASFTSSMAFLVSAIASSAFVMRFCKSTLGGRMTSAVSISTELSPSSVVPNSVSASALLATRAN